MSDAREAFEKWAGTSIFDMERHCDGGDYCDVRTQVAYLGYQAGMKEMQRLAAQACRDRGNLIGHRQSAEAIESIEIGE